PGFRALEFVFYEIASQFDGWLFGMRLASGRRYNERHVWPTFRREAHLRRLPAVPRRRAAARVDRRGALRDADARLPASDYRHEPQRDDLAVPEGPSARARVRRSGRRHSVEPRRHRTGRAVHLPRAHEDARAL